MAERPRHYPSLDGLRGLAILLVIPHNTAIVAPVLQGPFRFFTLLINRGWVGVELFFVLSGFLITEQLYSSRHASNYFGGFYARRVLRIVPLVLAAVVLDIFLIKIMASRGAAAGEPSMWILWFGLLFINWTQPLGLGMPGFPQFWSLALEEQFYLVWPVVVRAFASRLMAVIIGIAVLAFAVRVVMLLVGASSYMVYMWTISRMDALAFGAMAALIVRRWRVRSESPASWPWIAGTLVVLLIGALVSRLYAADIWTTQTVGYTCLGLASMLILLGGVANDLSPQQTRLFVILRTRFLSSVGRYSYGMYVFHMFFAIFAAAWVKRVTAPFGNTRMLACALLMIALSYGAGFLSYHLYEKHFLRLARRYFAPLQSPAS